MKRLIVLGTLLFLAACSGKASGTYELTFRTENPEDQKELARASLRVIERRLEAKKEPLLDKDIRMGTGSALLTVAVETEEALAALTQELTAPFSLRMMAATDDPKQASITVENYGGFRETGIDQEDFLWVRSRENPETQKGEVQLLLTEEGGKKVQDLFQSMLGKNVGLFVRDRLVSLLLVQESEVSESLQIQNIPSPELAAIFADDANVGMHVTFTPVP